MTLFPTRRHSLLAAAVAAVLALGAVVPAHAQSAQERRAAREAQQEARRKGGGAKQEQRYPNATRPEPEFRASSKAGAKLQKLIDVYNEDKFAEARAQADAMIADAAFNDYDHAFAAMMAARAAWFQDPQDGPAAIAYAKKAIELNTLSNNDHFDTMSMLATMQMNEEATYPQALATFDRFLTESGSKTPDQLATKGQLLYQMGKYPEAIAVFKPLVESTPEPKEQWLSMLSNAYLETNDTAAATGMAERIAAKDPTNKRAQMNLVATYQQAEQYDKAAAVLEKMRAAGLLTEAQDYKVLYSNYSNMDGREKDIVNAINDGLAKGILKPEYQVYLALAQSLYYSDQIPAAIEAYKTGAPLASDGEMYLNLAKLYWQEDRIPEAKEAAKQAMAKGLKKPDEAKKILALPAK